MISTIWAGLGCQPHLELGLTWADGPYTCTNAALFQVQACTSESSENTLHQLGLTRTVQKNFLVLFKFTVHYIVTLILNDICRCLLIVIGKEIVSYKDGSCRSQTPGLVIILSFPIRLYFLLYNTASFNEFSKKKAGILLRGQEPQVCTLRRTRFLEGQTCTLLLHTRKHAR